MLKWTIILSFLTFTFGLSAETTEKENLFQKALAAYQNKQYAEARTDFNKILESGIVSPELLHNTALADYQLGEKARALAFWRKALSIEPGYSPARQGRSFVESELQQRGYERDGISQWLYRMLEFISFVESLWLLALIIGIAGWLWIRYLSERWAALEEERPLPAFPTVAVILTGIFALCFSLSALKGRSLLQKRATIVANTASARSLPAEDGVNLFDLRGGSEVLVRRHDGEWSQILNSDGASGWIKNSELLVTSGW